MSGRSSHWLINISGYSYTMNIKEHLKQLKEKVIEKYNSGNGYKKNPSHWTFPGAQVMEM